MPELSDVGALVELMAEVTHRSENDCLKILIAMSRGDEPPIPRIEAARKAKLNGFKPFDGNRFREFLNDCTSGIELSAQDICRQLKMYVPAGSKSPAYGMRDAGWMPKPKKVNGQRVYWKP